jgi:holo-ACP synthase
MNIPGPIKTTTKIQKAFDIGCKEIEKALQATKIFDSTRLYKPTGDEWIFCAEGDAAKIKALMSNIEDSHPLGRLFDIDVIDVNGEKLSRTAFRKCLICNAQAQACARSRKHSIFEMQNKTEEILKSFLH